MTQPDFEQSWRARYDQWALKYDADHLISGWSAEGLQRRFRLFCRLMERVPLRPGGRVLDLGAGPGAYTREISSRGLRCVGADYSHNVLLAARRRGGQPYVQADAYHLPFRNGTFDAVVCIGVLQSLEKAADALGEMARVLSPGGWLFLDGLNRFFWLFWLRRARSLGQSTAKRLNDYSPYRIREICKEVGLSRSEIHWLTVPRRAQGIAAPAREHEIKRVGAVVGHSFLLLATKV